MSLIKKAKRSEAYLKIGMSGPSGSGKTYSALLLAKGLVSDMSKVVVIDSENGSANLYEDLGDYSVLPFSAPFGPDRYVRAIEMCVAEGFEAIIIDSVSHAWEGPGGCLDLQQKLGGRFQDWKDVTPLHQRFVQAILQSKAHVISTVRRKQDYSLEKIDGKLTVKKMGLKEVQKDGWEYDMSVNFDIDINHTCKASKDRTQLFPVDVPFTITEETGKRLRDWNKGAE